MSQRINFKIGPSSPEGDSGDGPRDAAARRGHEQYWHHEPGCEYLVANPIHVPDLSKLLDLPMSSTHSSITFAHKQAENDGISGNSRDRNGLEPDLVSDPFERLAAEITAMILGNLGSKDICNLRLASRSFRELPTILFRRLLLDDMPWMWEVKGLPADELNWYDLYISIRNQTANMKGLQNRKRIWSYVEELFERTQRYDKQEERALRK